MQIVRPTLMFGMLVAVTGCAGYSTFVNSFAPSKQTPQVAMETYDASQSGKSPFCEEPPPPPPPKKPADSYVVLVPNEDGTTGGIIVSDKSNNTAAVTEAGLGVMLENTAAGAKPIDKDKLLKDFAEAMAVRPPLPVKFLLYFKSGDANRLTAESEAMIPQILREVETRPVPDVSIMRSHFWHRVTAL